MRGAEMPKRIRSINAAVLILVGAIGGLILFGSRAKANDKRSADKPAAKDQIPMFEKDPNWPKPLPNGWYFGQVTGISIDQDGHIWVIHRPGGERSQDPAKEAARKAEEAKRTDQPAPRVVEFDKDGNYIKGWGGPSDAYSWPQEEHGITVDTQGHVWISGHTDSFTPPSPALPAKRNR